MSNSARRARTATIDTVVHHTLVAGIAVGLVLLLTGLALSAAGRGGLAVGSLRRRPPCGPRSTCWRRASTLSACWP